jgi:hypothetical protein
MPTTQTQAKVRYRLPAEKPRELAKILHFACIPILEVSIGTWICVAHIAKAQILEGSLCCTKKADSN